MIRRAFQQATTRHKAQLQVLHQSHQRAYHASSSADEKDIFHRKSQEEWRTFFEQRQDYGLLKHLNFEFVSMEYKKLTSKMVVQQHHMAANGYLHAASVMFLADTACGFGCFAHLPTEQKGFTTIEVKSNFMSTAKVGDVLYCEAVQRHGGRTTQVWDAEVYLIVEKNGVKERKVTALFRCTQALLNYQRKVENF